MARAAELGVTLSFHVNHIYYYGEALRDDILGPERMQHFMPVASAKRAGVRFSLHADSPMYPALPLTLVRTAVTRKTRNGAVIAPDEAISVEDALRAVTIDAAWQLFSEAEVGSLEVGKYADLTVLAEDPRRVDPDTIDQIEVIGTYLAGRRVEMKTNS